MDKSKKNDKDLKERCLNNTVNEHYKPFLIHASTYSILTDQILTLMPSQRNVLLSINEYELCKINPTHPKTSDSPTHVILFCIRFIADDTFQPIGGLLIYKQIDQSMVLAECIKAYITDLWKLNLHVVATVSPPCKIFKDILRHLVAEKEFDNHSDVISYSVDPIKDIIHIYDIQFLIIKLQNLLQEGDILFKTQYKDKEVLAACWSDISVIMNIAPEFKMISDFLSSQENVQRRVHIFTEQILTKYLEVKANGLLSVHAEGCAELLKAVKGFLKFFEYDFVYPSENMTLNWSDLIYILGTMTFEKTEQINCNIDSTPAQKNVENFNTSNKRTDKKNNSNISNNSQKEGLSQIHELCEMLKKTKSFSTEKVSIDQESKTEAFDLKAALREMDCDINLMNYGDDESKKKKNNTKSINRNDIVNKNYKISTNKETGNDIKNIKYCDNVLFEKDNVENKGEPPDYNSFTRNCFTQELLCTARGIEKLILLMASKGVRQIKPDAFIVEHIDYLVTKIQSTINLVDSVHYYGHPYTFMNTELAFSTLSNTKGLYLISKD